MNIVRIKTTMTRTIYDDIILVTQRTVIRSMATRTNIRIMLVKIISMLVHVCYSQLSGYLTDKKCLRALLLVK